MSDLMPADLAELIKTHKALFGGYRMMAEGEPPAEPAAEAPQPAEVDYKAKYEEAIANSRKWEGRAKENSTAAARLAEIEDAAKTEAEKTAERLAALEAENNSYKTREQVAAWKAEVAEATGVPVAALAGSTKEAIEAHAEILKPLIASPAQPATAAPVPTIAQAPGRPVNLPIKDQIAAAEAAGDKALAGQLKAMMLATGQ